MMYEYNVNMNASCLDIVNFDIFYENVAFMSLSLASCVLSRSHTCQGFFPGIEPVKSVLQAGLGNGNPVIHPPISLLNGARFENEGAKMFFYADGVSPTVAALIKKLDEERMALCAAMGYEPVPDPVFSAMQGYVCVSVCECATPTRSLHFHVTSHRCNHHHSSRAAA